MKKQQNVIVPEPEGPIPIATQQQMPRRRSGRMSIISIETPRDPQLSTRRKSIIQKVEEIGEMGAIYYAPHTEMLSKLESQAV